MFSFAPPYEQVEYNNLTDYQKQCLTNQLTLSNIETYRSTPHLTLSLKKKERYSIHYRELQFYVKVNAFIILVKYYFFDFITKIYYVTSN